LFYSFELFAQFCDVFFNAVSVYHLPGEDLHHVEHLCKREEECGEEDLAFCGVGVEEFDSGPDGTCNRDKGYDPDDGYDLCHVFVVEFAEDRT